MINVEVPLLVEGCKSSSVTEISGGRVGPENGSGSTGSRNPMAPVDLPEVE